MKLNDIINGLETVSITGDLNIDITNIAYDSRKVEENTLFICIKGFNSDGHKYIESAIEKGAKAFLIQDDVNIEGYTFIKVEDTRSSMAKLTSSINRLNCSLFCCMFHSLPFHSLVCHKMAKLNL